MKEVFIVDKYFIDLHDDLFEYNAKDLYPRDGYEPTKERIEELLSSDNRQNTPLISRIRLNSLKVTQLKEIAIRNNIDGYSDKNKKELIELLKEKGCVSVVV